MLKKAVTVLFVLIIAVFSCSCSSCQFEAEDDFSGYTITFDADGGTLSFYSEKVNTGEEYSLPTAEKAGYRLACYIYTFGGTEYIMDGSAFSFRTDITVKAVWAPDGAYIINYHLYGGIVRPANPYYYFEDSEDITLNNPEKYGYRFAGWTGSGYDTPTKTVIIAAGSTGDKEFFADIREAEYTVSLVLDCVAKDPVKEDELTEVTCTYNAKRTATFTVKYGDYLEIGEAVSSDERFEFLRWLYYKDGVLTPFGARGDNNPVAFTEDNFEFGKTVYLYVYCVPYHSSFE